jgi:hypothetical protein
MNSASLFKLSKLNNHNYCRQKFLEHITDSEGQFDELFHILLHTNDDEAAKILEAKPQSFQSI